MTTPFSHTTRSIEFDSYSLSLAGLLSAIILAILWGNWFFTAQITHYANSQKIYVTDKERLFSQFPKNSQGSVREQIIRQRMIVAEFPPAPIQNIKVGQIAHIRLDNSRHAGSIPATVEEIQHINEKDIVILRTNLDFAIPNLFKKGNGGEVQIEVGYVTPAIMVLNASGLLTETAPLSSSSR